jgi:anti-sigma B factor antagonist
MQLRLESRPVGEVLIVQCHGRIVAGNEVSTLHSQVGDSIDKYGDVVLQLDQVEFVDSSGLGALVRLMRAARSKGGDLKLCGLQPRIRKTLELTSLLSQFETYDSVEEAITAAYLGSRYSRGKAGDARPRMLCVFESIDVCTFLREVLCNAGYNALYHSERQRRQNPAQGNEGETLGALRAPAIRSWQTHSEDVGGS